MAYSCLRPLHTNAVIFTFGGNALIANSFYVVQRNCHVALISNRLANTTFWGYQLIIPEDVLTLLFGYTQSKEYAELLQEASLTLKMTLIGLWLTHLIPQDSTIFNELTAVMD